MSDAKTVTFEKGYERLQAIAERVNSEEVPVDELCDLFAEGKGLEKALSDYLAEQKARVEKIERGEGVQSFKVEAPSNGAVKAEPPPAVAPEAPSAEQATASANGAEQATATAATATAAAPEEDTAKKAQPEPQGAQPQALGQ